MQQEGSELENGCREGGESKIRPGNGCKGGGKPAGGEGRGEGTLAGDKVLEQLRNEVATLR